MILLTVNMLCATNKVRQGEVTIACDNKSALRTAFEHNHISSNSKSRDILQAIHQQKNLLNIKWTPRHVKGHQDDKKTTELDTWETTNVECDKLAEDARTNTSLTPPHVTLPGELWRLRLGTDIITGHAGNALIHHCFRPIAIEYWGQRGRFNTEQSRNINWNAFCQATTKIRINQQTFLTKFYSGFHCTGKVMKRRGEWNTDECPMCQHQEDHEHVIKCTSECTTKNFEQAYGELDDWILRTSSKEISEAVYVLITDYRDNEQHENVTYTTWSQDLQNAVLQQ